MALSRKLDYVILDLIETGTKVIKTAPLNLGGYGGENGGVGAPPGGYIGWLPQTSVAYDETEAATLSTAPSGLAAPSGWSLLDNLNHIRYRLGTLESGILVVDEYDGNPTVSNVTWITFSGGAQVSQLAPHHVLVNITASGGSGSGIAGVDVLEDGVLEGTDITNLNFTGNLDVSVSGDTATISGVQTLGDGPEAFGWNYKIVVTSITTSTTVAIKTLAGNDPSSTDKIVFRIGGTRYEVTSALSVTFANNVNWMNCGSAELANLNVNFFVYIIAETGGSAGIKMGIARIPYARTMNSFVNTNTNEKYILGNWTNFNTSDLVENVGRITGSISTSSTYYHSFTNNENHNIARPIFETDWLTWTPTPTGFSSNPALIARYKLIGQLLHLSQDYTAAGTSNSTDFTETAPFKATNELPTYFQYSPIPLLTNNGANEAAGVLWIEDNTNVLTLRRSAAATWTASGGKAAAFNIAIEI